MLQELNKESLLLLYLADELSVKDRAEVDRMLASDAGLRLELDRLEGTIQAFESGMARLDAMPATGESLTMRNIAQAMRGQLARQLVQPVAEKPAAQPKLRYPWWAYPSVAAAVILITFISWWGTRPDTMISTPADPHSNLYPPHVHPYASTGGEDEVQLAQGIQDNFAELNPTQPEKSVASLNAAEDQIAELSRTQSDFRQSDGNE